MASLKNLAALAATATIATTMLTGGVADAKPLSSTSPGECSTDNLIAVPGGGNTLAIIPPQVPHGDATWNAGRADMLEILGPDTSYNFVTYNSVPFVVDAYQDNTDKAVAATNERLTNLHYACPESKFTLLGYSEGADAISHVAEQIGNGNGPVPADSIRGVIALANPHNGTGVNTIGAENEGILDRLDGGYGELTDRVVDICHEGDFVCDPKDRWRRAAGAGSTIGPLLGKFPSLEDTSSAATAVGSSDVVDLPIGGMTHVRYGAPDVRAGLEFIANR